MNIPVWMNEGWQVDRDGLLDFLYHDIPSASARILGGNRGFEHSQLYLDRLGNPQDQVPAIHIVGTAGKGSVAYLTASILCVHGFDVGLSVSPHVYDYRERMLVNLACPPWSLVVDEVNSQLPVLRDFVRQGYGPPTFYELTMAATFRLFRRLQLDYSVIEAGVGGRRD